MWDQSKPEKLIKALPFDSFSLQHIIDTDKLIGSTAVGYNLCGTYAPFCAVCSKWAENPCVTAYRIYERMGEVCPMFSAAGIDDPAIAQVVADVDKFLASESFGLDLCGRYAPFCAVCDKSEEYPCGQAYLRYKAVEDFSTKALYAQAGGQLIISAPRWDDALTQALEDISVDDAELNEAEENNVAEEQPVAEEPATLPQEEKPRRSFRIATARRRNAE